MTPPVRPYASAFKNRAVHGPDHRTVPLTLARTGQAYRVVAVAGGCGVQVRLAGMGILPGQVIKIISANGVGPVVVSVKGSRLALGRGVSAKLLLTPQQDGGNIDEPASQR